MMDNTSRPKRRVAGTDSPTADDEQDLDERYAALVLELDQNLDLALGSMGTALSEDQRSEVLSNWRTVGRPALVEQLNALIGPPVPVLAEACAAYNHVSYQASQSGTPKNHNVCDGDTVAVVTRFGSPEAPGRIFRHDPGCMKHARMAISRLGVSETRVWTGREHRRVFHSIIALADARREIRQQELADQAARSRRWWRRG